MVARTAAPARGSVEQNLSVWSQQTYKEAFTTTTEQNKALIREFVDLINAQDLDTALTLLSPDLVDHTPPAGLPLSIDGVRAFFTMVFAVFSDGYVTSMDMIAEGDRVVNWTSGEGIHQGDFLGFRRPAGISCDSFIDIWCIANGKLTEHWIEADMMGMTQQLGVVPPPPGALNNLNPELSFFCKSQVAQKNGSLQPPSTVSS